MDKLRIYLLGQIAGAAVGALLGLVGTYLMYKAPKLHYALSPLASFPSDKEAFSIQELRVTNVGNEKETKIIINIYIYRVRGS